jgi:hypothetical protein
MVVDTEICVVRAVSGADTNGNQNERISQVVNVGKDVMVIEFRR